MITRQMWGCRAHLGIGNMLLGNNSRLAAIRSDRRLHGKPIHVASSSPS
jgi:hypothetical protein